MPKCVKLYISFMKLQFMKVKIRGLAVWTRSVLRQASLFICRSFGHECPGGVPVIDLLSALNITMYIIEVMNENTMTAHKYE